MRLSLPLLLLASLVAHVSPVTGQDAPVPPPVPSAPTATAIAPQPTATLHTVTTTASVAELVHAAVAGDLEAMAAVRKLGTKAKAELVKQQRIAYLALARTRALLAELASTHTPPPESKTPPPWIAAKIAEAERRIAAENHLGAIHVLEALAVLEPTGAWRRRLQTLKIKAEELYVRKHVLAARLVVGKTIMGPDDPLNLELELSSQATDKLELSSQKTATNWAGFLEFDVYRADPDGDIHHTRSRHNIRVPVPPKLNPKQTWRTSLPLKDISHPPRAVTRIRIRGTLIPDGLRLGDDTYSRFVPLFSVTVTAAPHSRHALAVAPAKEVEASILWLRSTKNVQEHAQATTRLFYASLFVCEPERDHAIGLLLGTLKDKADPAGPAAITALRGLLERPDLTTRDAWLNWR